MTTPPGHLSEYDMFGPWVDEVRTPAEVPRLFRDHPVDLDAARLVLKVPRNIARRDATPDMDLYDHLLVLTADAFTVLSRRGAPDPARRGAPLTGGYDVTTVPTSQVVAIRDVVSLLDGRLTVHAHDGSRVTVPYNGAATTTIHQLVGQLRAVTATSPPSTVGRALLEAARPEVSAVALDPGRDDLALAGEFREIMREHPGVALWACHGRTALRPTGSGVRGLAQAALHTLSPTTLHGAVLGSDGRVLEVVARRDWLVRGRAAVHSTSRLVLPLSAPDALHVAPHARYPEATTATITAGATRLEVVVPTGSVAHRILRAAE